MTPEPFLQIDERTDTLTHDAGHGCWEVEKGCYQGEGTWEGQRGAVSVDNTVDGLQASVVVDPTDVDFAEQFVLWTKVLTKKTSLGEIIAKYYCLEAVLFPSD